MSLPCDTVMDGKHHMYIQQVRFNLGEMSCICRGMGGGSWGTSPSLHLTFPPTGLSENLGGMERGMGGKGEREGWGEITYLTSPHWLLPQIPPWAQHSLKGARNYGNCATGVGTKHAVLRPRPRSGSSVLKTRPRPWISDLKTKTETWVFRSQDKTETLDFRSQDQY